MANLVLKDTALIAAQVKKSLYDATITALSPMITVYENASIAKTVIDPHVANLLTLKTETLAVTAPALAAYTPA